jgi:hypothetical protein
LLDLVADTPGPEFLTLALGIYVEN